MFRALSLLLIMFCVTTLSANPNIHQHSSSPLTYAIRTGTDTNGTILYLCQARLFNSLQPGKTWAGYNRCNVPYGGKEYVVAQFTIPNQNEVGRFNWGLDARGAIQMGRDTNGNALFVCQANFHGGIQPGKTWPGYTHCNISYAGREIITDNYRVMSKQQEHIVGSRIPKTVHTNNIQPNIHSHY